jgi:hypothetical protein
LHLDLERAGLDANQRLDLRQKPLDDERFLRRLNLRNVEVDAGAGTHERFVVVERPERGHRDEAGHRFAGHGDLIEPHVNAGRSRKPRRPLTGRATDRVRPPLTFLRHLVRTIRPSSLEDVFGILQRGKDADRFGPRRSVGPEVGGRRVFEVRHVHRRRAVQRVERHVRRMPRTGQLETRIRQRVSVPGNGHVVVQPPAPLAVAAQDVVNQALDDLTERPELSRDGVLEGVVPFRPRIFFANRRRRFEERGTGRERGRDVGIQLHDQRGNRLFDVDPPAVDRSGAEQFGKFLENVLTNHDVVPSFVLARRD